MNTESHLLKLNALLSEHSLTLKDAVVVIATNSERTIKEISDMTGVSQSNISEQLNKGRRLYKYLSRPKRVPIEGTTRANGKYIRRKKAGQALVESIYDVLSA